MDNIKKEIEEEKGLIFASGEEKKNRFKRIASKRANIVLEKLRVLGNCSDRVRYEYSEDDINIIFSEIESAVEEVKARFQIPKKRVIRL